MIRNTILLVSDEAMPNAFHDKVPKRLLSLFTSRTMGIPGDHNLRVNISTIHAITDDRCGGKP